MVAIGEPTTIARHYNQLNFGRTVASAAPTDEPAPRPARRTRRRRSSTRWFEDTGGNRIAEIAYGERCCVAIEVRFNEAVVDPIFGVTLRNEIGHDGVRDDDARTAWARPESSRQASRSSSACDSRTGSRQPLHRSRRRSRAHGFGADAIDLREDIASLVVHGGAGDRRGRPAAARVRDRARDERPVGPVAGGRADRPEHRTSSVAPSAFGDDFRRFVNLTWTLAVTDFKLRYFGSVLGYVWSLMRPLLFFGVLYVVFTQIFGLGKGVPDYPVYLLTAIIFWTFFLEATVRLRPVPAGSRGAAAQDALPAAGDPGRRGL